MDIYSYECSHHDFAPDDYKSEDELYADMFAYIKVIAKNYDVLVKKDCGGVYMVFSVPNHYEYGDNVFMCITQEERERLLWSRAEEDEEDEEEYKYCSTKEEESFDDYTEVKVDVFSEYEVENLYDNDVSFDDEFGEVW